MTRTNSACFDWISPNVSHDPKLESQYGTRASWALVEAVSGGRLGMRDAADYLELTIGDLGDLEMLLRGQPLVDA